jgi:hypothetical protein
MFRLYEKSMTMVANQSCGTGRGNGRESRVRSEINQGYKEPICILVSSLLCTVWPRRTEPARRGSNVLACQPSIICK